ncbi:MAG: hypothetical protein A3G09_02640 [Candidatus Moranbacteria bacterium RIFCSPLOWO2_12_FULL_48_12]|nr:MAG: hypothetical protein A3G09_02640 [Candidatus Moranbacteria bacterium RIFCSPLOWO2_12_FULL_48_12]
MKTIDGTLYTERKDLQTKMFGIECYAPGEKTVENLFVRMTSGTTGGSPATALLRFILNKAALAFYEYAKPLLVINARNSTGLLWAQIILNQYAKPTRILFLNKKDIEHPLISSVIADFQPRVIHSVVHILNFFIDKLHGKKVSAFSKKITKIHISGEPPTQAFLKKLARIFPKGKIELRYAANELGTIAIDCPYLAKRYRGEAFQAYHPVNPVSIVASNQNGVGEIAVFSPTLDHYLTGDAGKIIKEKCRCGSTETLLLYGRMNYDIINCVGATFHIAEVERVFSLLRKYVADYYLEIREIFEEGKTLGSMTVKAVPTVKLQGMQDGEAFVSECIQKHLQLTKTRRLNDLIDAGIFLSPSILFVPSLLWPGKKIRMRKVND